MFDESDTCYSFIIVILLPWKHRKQCADSGVTCYVTLDAPYVQSGFGVYDTFEIGSLKIYDANTNTLLWFSDMNGYMYRNISMIEESHSTNNLKIVKDGGDLNELVIIWLSCT